MRARSGLTAATSAALVAGLALAGTSAASTMGARAGGARHTGRSATSGLAALYKQAVAAKQQSVVIYGPSAGTDNALYAAFQKQFPKITVSGVPVVGPPMSAKLAAEFASGKHVADIAYTGSTNMLQYAASGWLLAYTPSTLPVRTTLPRGSVGTKKTFYAVSEAVAGTIYNKSTVKASEVPKTWAALTSAKWKNKLGMYDPTAIGLMADVIAHLAKVHGGVGLIAKLKALNTELFPATNVTGPLAAVAEGAKAIGVEVPFGFYLVAKKAGAPIGFSLLKASNYSVTLYQGVVKGAPDPIAAKLYEAWMLTAPAAKALASEGDYSPIPGATAPAGLPPFAKVGQMPYIGLTQIGTADNAAITLAKRYWG